MFNPKYSTILTCALLVAPISAYAANTAEEIARINENVAVLSAKLSEIEIQSKLVAKQQEIVKLNALPPATPEALPVVSSIEGADGRLVATLVKTGGVVQSVMKGDRVEKWTVLNIEFNKVTLIYRKKLTRLAFGNAPPAVPISMSVPPLGH